MARVWRNNGLTIVLLALFALSLVGQGVTGWHVYDDDRREHEQPTVTFDGYLRTGHFVEAVFENWESEFLSSAAIVVLAIFLRRRDSPESKPVAALHRTTGEG